MGSFANSLFKIMLGWLQAAVSAVWSAFTNEKGNSIFNWIGTNWILIAGILCVIGLTADLCVYVFRWKPFEVWKSYFSRNKNAEVPEYKEQMTTSAEKATKPLKSFGENTVPKPVQTKKTNPEQEPDLSQWEAETGEEDSADVQPAERPATVTNAGYVVPEDSPYRRPSGKLPAYTLPGRDSEEKERHAAGADREEQNPVTPRRRRRISVTELFTDPEEELKPFDAPQHVIDSRKAYREPVYPHGWQKSEDNEE